MLNWLHSNSFDQFAIHAFPNKDFICFTIKAQQGSKVELKRDGTSLGAYPSYEDAKAAAELLI